MYTVQTIFVFCNNLLMSLILQIWRTTKNIKFSSIFLSAPLNGTSKIELDDFFGLVHSKRFNVIQNDPKRSKAIQSHLKQFKAIQSHPKRQSDSKQSKAIQSDPKRFKRKGICKVCGNSPI